MKGTGYADYANVSGVVGVIVARKLSTMIELQTVYSYEDALDMAEIITVQNYNEWVAADASSKG